MTIFSSLWGRHALLCLLLLCLYITPYFSNNPLPVGKENVHVLAIGNSYSIDALTYGVGCYIVCICWLNTIMSHIFNLNLYGTRSFHYCARYEEEKNDSFPSAIDVTEENYLLCQQLGIVKNEPLELGEANQGFSNDDN